MLSTLQRLFSKGLLVDLLPEFKNQRDARLLGRGSDFVHASCCVRSRHAYGTLHGKSETTGGVGVELLRGPLTITAARQSAYGGEYSETS